VEWQRNAGYLPLNQAGLLASESRLLAADLLNIHVGVQQLTHKKVTSISKASTYPQRAAVRASSRKSWNRSGKTASPPSSRSTPPWPVPASWTDRSHVPVALAPLLVHRCGGALAPRTPWPGSHCRPAGLSGGRV
jgi:hypothetical protein